MSNPIPDGWKKGVIGSFVKLQGGYAFKSIDSAGSGTRWLKIANVGKGKIKWDDKSYLPYNFGKEYSNFMLEQGDSVIALTRPITQGELKVALIRRSDVPSLLNQRVARILPKQHLVDRNFIYSLFRYEAIARDIEITIFGTDPPNISTKQIEEIRVILPPLPEQQKIAAILTSVDEVIEKTQAQIDKLKDLKTAMMQTLLTNGVGTKPASADAALNNSTAGRESYIPHTEFKDSPVGRIPKSWEVKPLSEYVSFLSYGFTNPMPESEAGPYMITAKDVYGLKIQYSKARKTTKAAYDDLLTRKSRPQVNDILLTKDGTLGRVALVEYENCCINQSVAVMTPNEKILPKFLLYLLASPSYQVEMLDKAGGSTIKHIYITIVDKMMLSVPCLSEQGRVVRIIDGLLNKIDLAEKKLLKIKNTKKALMQDLLTGKVRVKVDQ
jgi:type I restriction enzyme S subunit